MIKISDQHSPFLGNWTHGFNTDTLEGGAAWADGRLTVADGAVAYQCRSHRQAVRQLRHWLRGQGVTAVRIS